MSIKEFTKAAKIYDSGKSGIYEMCKYDYPKVLKELKNILIENNIDKNEAAAEVDFILKYLLNIKYEDIILQKKLIIKFLTKHIK